MRSRKVLQRFVPAIGQGKPPLPVPLVEASPYIPAGALRQQFETCTGQVPDSSLGAYALAPLGASLYIGVGNRPGRTDGALVLRARDTTLAVECVLAERGIHEIGVQDGVVWVPGSDATAGWDFGNVYLCDTAGWHMRRTVPNAVHCLGLWRTQKKLFLGAQLYSADNQHIGHVLVSSDDGLTWPQSAAVARYRVYDVKGHGNALYATGTAQTDYSGLLYRSVDDGVTWKRVRGIRPLMTARLALWDDRLVGVHHSQTALFVVEGDGRIKTHRLNVTVPVQWNVLADGGNGYLYILSTEGVWRTGDLQNWQYYCAFDAPIAITAWTEAKVIVVANQGLDAGLWIAPNGD
jgi:hypothetical protein